MKSLSMMTISEVSALLQARRVSPSEIVDEAIQNTRRLQGTLNPYITFEAEAARIRAAELTASMPEDLSERPLYGIPVGLKDLFYTKGVLTSGASKLFSSFYPDYDSTVAARLKQAGAVLMGKHNLQELACGATGSASYYGPMRNPYDPGRISGGSSGGSAIAVATGMNYAAMGSDSGGSIRIPAAMCGVVGFKPSQGLISLYGVMPLSESLDHAGPLTRSVLDAAIVMDAVTGFDPKDSSPNRYQGSPTAFARQLRQTDRLEGITIGVPENYFFDKTDVSIEHLIRDAVARMKDLGARIRPVRFDFLADLPEVSFAIALSEAAWSYKDHLKQNGDLMSPFIQARLQTGAEISAVEYLSAARRRIEILTAWNKIMQEVDVVICPTVPLTAFPIEGDMQVTLRGKQEDGLTMCTYHTRLSNLTGAPALSMPVGFAADGLPASMMIMGALGDDCKVLSIGHVYETHYPFSYPKF